MMGSLGIGALLTLGCMLGAIPGEPGTPAVARNDRQILGRVVETHFDSAFLTRARSYQRPRVILFLAEMALVLLVAAILLAGPWSRWGPSAIPRWLAESSVLSRIWLLTLLYTGFELLQFPFHVVLFRHARAAGLRHDSWASFLGDAGKAFAVGWVQVVVAGLLVLWLLAAFPRKGWILGAAGIGALASLYMILAPLVIDPLFHRFHSLEDAALRERLLGIATAGGVPARDILVADASRRTRAVNAYFTGLGTTPRIVLYDTLLERFDHDEIAVVLAHEVGHWKHRHVAKGLAWGTLGALVALGSLSWLFARAGVSGRSDPALAIPAFAWAMLLLVLGALPANFISRRMETEADRTSLELTADPQTFVRSEVHLV
ncbi:MAG TPA: M48 family metalloprotease, partial [Candidatus Eisenbacteria bacterium]|nr:M48 family metalloprotease [Candidatus Eisenbacteria bacterium]